MVLDTLRTIFTSTDTAEEYTVPVPDTPRFYRERHGDTLDELQTKEEQIRAAVEDTVTELEEYVETLADFEDADQPAAVNDIAANIARTRRTMLQKFSLPDGEEAVPALESFIDEFQSLTRKEAEAVKRIPPARTLLDELQAVQEHLDALQRFYEEDHIHGENYATVKELATAIEEKQDKIREYREKRDDLGVDSIEAEIEAVEEEQAALDTHEDWEELEQLREEKQELEAKRDDIQQSVNEAVSRMERGLKKILYEIDNNEYPVSDTVRDALHDLREGSVRGDSGMVDAIEKLPALVEQTGVLSGRYRDAFLDAAASLETLSADLAEQEELAEQIQEKKEEINTFPLKERERELQTKKEQLKREREEVEERRSTVKEKIEALQEEVESAAAELEDVLNAACNAEITVTVEE